MAAKSKMRTVLKNFDKALEAGDKAEVDTKLVEAVSILDRTASKGIIHKKAAARKKSRLYKAASRI